jgi:phosphoribosylformimino-5-aminoimidazole carboxamide ribotide isomerase
LFEQFTVIPSIDLKGGEVVRLRRGEAAHTTVYGNDPAAAARSFEEQGAQLIHVVDLDGAFAGKPRNLGAVRAIRAAVKCVLDVSGGLRSMASVQEAFAAGADRISIGSAALLDPDLLTEACRAYPGCVFGSIDLRAGRLAIKGWVETSRLTGEEAAERFRNAGAAAIIVTDISRDGTEAGIDQSVFAAMARTVGLPVIASGGVARLDDIGVLKVLFRDGVVGVIIGRALYEGRFTLTEALATSR